MFHLGSQFFALLRFLVANPLSLIHISDIYVSADANNPLVLVLNILNKETGEWEKVSMPKSARITGMSVLGVTAAGTVELSLSLIHI